MCKARPTARISDNKLVLSLPDAMTPVVWMIDLSDKNSFVLKVDRNENGLFIVQKISADGKKLEDIAYYTKKSKAVKAMTSVSKVMHNQSSDATYSFGHYARVIGLTIFVMIAIDIVWAYSNADTAVMDMAGLPTETRPAPLVQSAPQQEFDPNTAGVPMSADDYLNQKGNLTFPF